MDRMTLPATVAFGYLMAACATVHGLLIQEHWQMSWFEGASFLVMTLGCVALAVSVPVTFTRPQGGAGNLVLWLGVIFLVGMILAYFYVHYTQWWVPPFVEHEGPESDGTISVVIEAVAIVLLLLAWRGSPAAGARHPASWREPFGLSGRIRV